MESRCEQSVVGWGHTENDALDHELDAALAKYAAVEPRAGLEERVLAHLQSEREHAPRHAWWHWSVVSAGVAITAMAVLMMAWLWRTNVRQTPAVAHQPPRSAPTSVSSGQASSREDVDNRSSARKSAPSLTMGRPHPVAVAIAPPKLPQFPSPLPLSEQEKILASYVNAYPERAVLLARARTEALRQDQIEERQASTARAWPPDSEVQMDSEVQTDDTTQR
jgi:hypothetical protein